MLRTRFPKLSSAALLAVLAVGLVAPAPTSAAWSGWRELPGNGYTYDAPSAVQVGNRLFVFVRGGGNGVYYKIWNGSTSKLDRNDWRCGVFCRMFRSNG